MRYALGIVFFLSPWPTIAEDRPPPAKPPQAALIVVEKCTIEYERSSTVGAFVLIQAGGRIQDAYVRQGDRVKAGQVLGRLHDRDARAELERLNHEVEDNIAIPLGECKLAQTLVNLGRSRTLFKKNLYSRTQLESEELDFKALELDLGQAKHDRRQNELMLVRVEAEIRSREMVAPHDGMVVEVLKRVGESTAVNESVYRIVALDRLRVTGQIDVKDAWRVRVGMAVRVSPELASVDLPIEREAFGGQVSFVDPQIDPDSMTCKVVAEVDNRDELLRSGLEGRMEILLGAASAPADRRPPTARENSQDSSPSVEKR